MVAAHEPEEGLSPAAPTESLMDPAAARAHVLVTRVHLTVIEGPDAGAVRASSRPTMVIGSHESADLALSDRAVSRFHCELAVDGDRLHVRDLGSRNGTLVDGVTVIHAVVRSGAVITVGRTKLRVSVGGDPVKVPVAERTSFGLLVAQSPVMRAIFALLERAAASDATVLLEGETGTGKEAAAETIHREGARRDGPLVVVDCGAVPAELLESELFGHEKGAFTGALKARPGAFQAANGGTIFLDEIGELAPALQPKLLRALQERQIKRVGTDRYVPVDVRVIAATNRNLRAEVNAGRFRADLYYRLAVLEIRLPPLRERREDLPLLVEHMLTRLNVQDRPGVRELFTESLLQELSRHAWPGNVRELGNYVERCLALRAIAELPPPLAEPGDKPLLSLKAAREAFERAYLVDILERHGGNVTASARAAGVDRIQFYRMLWRNGLR
ncbi:MAG: sigma 54-interacting transcriptional regulator [Minicystis sp.]